jgi:hypothetical protein
MVEHVVEARPEILEHVIIVEGNAMLRVRSRRRPADEHGVGNQPLQARRGCEHVIPGRLPHTL